MCFLAQASENDHRAAIQSHLKKSEEATTISHRGDKAIFHAVIAESLLQEHQINDPQLEREIQLKFIGAFRLVNQPENAKKHLKLLLGIDVREGHFASSEYLLNAGRLASDYLRGEELDSALTYFLLANKSANQLNENLYQASTLNNLGILYEKKEDWEKAIQHYNWASDSLLFDHDADSAFWTSINDNKANYYFHTGDSLIGIALLRANLNYLKKKPKFYKKFLQYGFRLFDILIQKNDWREASNLLKTIKSFLQFGRHNWYSNNLIQYHENNLKLVQHKNNKVAILQEYKILDSLKSLELKQEKEQRVLMNNTMSDYFLISADSEIEREKEKAIQAAKENEQKTLFIAFLILIFLCISLLIRSSNKRKLRAKSAEKRIKEQELKLKGLENDKLSRDLHHQSNDFSDLMMQTSLKEDWSSELIQQLEELSQEKENVDFMKLKGIIRGLKQKSGVYDRVNLQQKGITEVNSAFFDHLDKKYPKLTKSERELCGLIRLRLDGKEIAVIRNIHPSSVRKLRHRLRKKLELPVEQDIYEFIAKV